MRNSPLAGESIFPGVWDTRRCGDGEGQPQPSTGSARVRGGESVRGQPEQERPLPVSHRVGSGAGCHHRFPKSFRIWVIDPLDPQETP